MPQLSRKARYRSCCARELRAAHDERSQGWLRGYAATAESRTNAAAGAAAMVAVQMLGDPWPMAAADLADPRTRRPARRLSWLSALGSSDRRTLQHRCVP